MIDAHYDLGHLAKRFSTAWFLRWKQISLDNVAKVLPGCGFLQVWKWRREWKRKCLSNNFITHCPFCLLSLHFSSEPNNVAVIEVCVF